MAVTHGKNGAVYLSGGVEVAEIVSWTCNYDPAWSDASSMGTAGKVGKKQLAGIPQAKGNVVVNWDTADTNGQEAMKAAVTGFTTVRLYLYLMGGGDYWEFNANLDIADNVSKDDTIKRTFNFQSNGAISLN